MSDQVPYCDAYQYHEMERDRDEWRRIALILASAMAKDMGWDYGVRTPIFEDASEYIEWARKCE